MLLSLAYLLPIALLGILIGSRQRHERRWILAVLALLPVFYIGHYLGLQAIQGWPSRQTLPDDFQLLGFDIVEPDNDRPGHILIWARASAAQQPRVHRLGYDRDLHHMLADAGSRQSEGTPQRGRRLPAETAGTAAVGSPDGSHQLRFEDALQPRLPEKDDDS